MMMSESDRDAKFYYNKATGFNNEGKFGLAIDNFKIALTFDPNSLEILFNLGVAYINKKEYGLAVECFDKVLAISPDEVAALSNVALAHAKNHNFITAISYYKKVLEINPEDTSTYKDLADVYTKNRQYDEAIEYYQKFLAANPHSAVVKESLKTAINLKRNSEGYTETAKVPEVTQETQYDPENNESAETYFNSAINYIKEQKFDLAIENIRNCLKVNPNYPNAYELLNKLFKIKEKMGNEPPKKTSGETAKTQPPVQPPKPPQPIFIDYMKLNECFTLGVAYYNVGNYSMALDNFKKCIEINPNDTQSREYISKINTQLSK